MQSKSNSIAIAGNQDAFRNNAFVACEISVTLESIMTFPKYGSNIMHLTCSFRLYFYQLAIYYLYTEDDSVPKKYEVNCST